MAADEDLDLALLEVAPEDDGAALVIARADEEEEQSTPGRFDDLNKELYDPTPSDSCQYGKASFWDQRYADTDEIMEWYQPYETLRDLLIKFMAHDDRILHIGCGNSELAEHMVEDGFTNITNVDMSRVVIDQMDEKYGDSLGEGVSFEFADITDMRTTFEDMTFDVVIDKACFDALYCAPLSQKNVLKALHEIDRVLTPQGVFISISFARPELRLPNYDNPVPSEKDFLPWHVEVHTIPKPTVNPYAVPDFRNLDELYFIYVCSKDAELHSAMVEKRMIEKAKALGLYKPKKKKKQRKRPPAA